MTRRLTVLALALVLALSLTGCWEAEPEPDDFWNDDPSSPTEETPRREPAQISDFTLPYLSGQTFDPVTCIDGVQQTVGALLYEPLFTLDTSFTPQPVLCERSSCDAQALTWTFALRSGLDPSRIDVHPDCTKCRPDRYWSHRGMGGERGGMAAVIVLTEDAL